MKLILLYCSRIAGYLCMKRYHTVQFVLLLALLKRLINETKITFHGFVAVYVEDLRWIFSGFVKFIYCFAVS
jgi:ABC-type uncharacterized transport system permease subunit